MEFSQYEVEQWWNKLEENWLSVIEIISQFTPQNIEAVRKLKDTKDNMLWYCLEDAYDVLPYNEESCLFDQWVTNLPGFDKFLELEREGWILFEE